MMVVVYIVLGALVLTGIMALTMRGINASMQPGQVWTLKDPSWVAPSPYGEPVEIINQKGPWVKFQGVTSGSVWCLTTEAFWTQYTHTGKSIQEYSSDTPTQETL